MNKTPKGNRLHISIFGKRNVGKSSFINSFTEQELSIVSSVPGTTTDPVEKAYELLPFGPILLTDTAGYDDTGTLGKKRISKTFEILKRTDFAILLVGLNTFDEYEENLVNRLAKSNTPWMIIINKADTRSKEDIDQYQKQLSSKYKIPVLPYCSLNQDKLNDLKNIMIKQIEDLSPPPPIIKDLITKNDTVVLVMPVDKEAPTGRLILPQAQTVRECLDANVTCIVIQESELDHTLKNVLKHKPKLVVTDSQVFKKVNETVPSDIMITSFSILFARQKGDLSSYIQGLNAIKELKNDDNILIAELCSHHSIYEDIGRVKIPKWLREKTGLKLNFDISSGKNFPEDLSSYKLVIQCGGCMVNRKLIMSRIHKSNNGNIPITNYGLIIADILGIVDRVMTPFPDTLKLLK